MHWFCDSCTPSAISAVKSDNLIEEKCKHYFERFKEDFTAAVDIKIDNKLKVVQEQMTDMREENKMRFEEVNRKLDEENKVRFEEINRKLEKSTSNAADISCKEVLDRDERKMNLVIFNVAESEKAEPNERKEDDERAFSTLCQELEVDASPKSIVRLGKKSDTARPMKVTLRNTEDVKNILSAAKKLAKTVNPLLVNVSLKKDQTPLEREERRKLVAVRKEKQAESDNSGQKAKWVIRKGAVINVQRGDLPGGR